MARTDGETDLGGKRRDFPSTCWSKFLNVPRDRRPEAAEALAASYWKPIYAYLRSKWTKSNEEAKDLTQDFFIWMAETDFVSRADPGRGRFRAFVKVALDHYVVSDDRKQAALKRGGKRILSLEDAPARLADIGLPDPAARSPQEALDTAWRNDLLSRAAAKLQESFEAEGRSPFFLVFRDYHLGADADVRYQDLAAKHRLGESEVINHLREARRRFREIMIDLVAETAESEDDLRMELKTLFGGTLP